MNKVLILINITGLIIGISYGLHGPILPVFAKNIIGATYSELGLIGLANFIPYMFIPLFVGILLDRINKSGGIKGNRLDLIIEDDESTAAAL